MRGKRITTLALLTAMGAAIQVAEGFLPLLPAIPGGKLGAANIVTAVVLYGWGFPAGICVAMLRALLGALLGGGLSALPYSLAGAAVSCLGMGAAIRFLGKHLSPVGVCVIGAALHNTAQTAVAAVMLQSAAVIPYLALLLVISVLSGTATGVCTRLMIRRKSTWEKGN